MYIYLSLYGHGRPVSKGRESIEPSENNVMDRSIVVWQLSMLDM